ncbi:hypothetical protein NDU88_009183 [Pleurodeles waltl]|uniref:Mitochondrial import inner membrane translocase subunit Tim10 B n=1 Tax=Pleurodeles waltl TaxID=8319 RepID=A0AAV7P784_PLEWA|nr:hypothetical protein NDU88_009183 [Pleurodeles waltl]
MAAAAARVTAGPSSVSLTQTRWRRAAAEPRQDIMEGEQAQLRNLRDFLLVYNRMTEICFSRCVSNMNYRTVTMDEEKCLDSCASKLIRSNHRLMSAYVGLMPGIVQRRISDQESKAAELNQIASSESTPVALAAGDGTEVQSMPSGESLQPVPSSTADSSS